MSAKIRRIFECKVLFQRNLKLQPQYRFKVMAFNAVSRLQISDLLGNFRVFRVFRCFPADEQHVLRCVLHLDELHHLGLVAELFENQGADGVGDHHGLTFKEYAVARDGIETARTFHLLPDHKQSTPLPP